MSRVLEGNFAVHRTKTVNGKDAILVIPEPDGEVLLLDECPMSFELFRGGENPPESYLTVTHGNGDRTHFGPEGVVRPV